MWFICILGWARQAVVREITLVMCLCMPGILRRSGVIHEELQEGIMDVGVPLTIHREERLLSVRSLFTF
jgi:hypothetical protein